MEQTFGSYVREKRRITEWITAAASWYIYRKHAVEKA